MNRVFYMWTPILLGTLLLAVSQRRRWEAISIGVSGISVSLFLLEK